MKVAKTLGSFIGAAIALVLLWNFLPFLDTHFKSITGNPLLGEREKGVIGILLVIIVIIVVLGTAAIIRSKFK